MKKTIKKIFYLFTFFLLSLFIYSNEVSATSNDNFSELLNKNLQEMENNKKNWDYIVENNIYNNNYINHYSNNYGSDSILNYIKAYPIDTTFFIIIFIIFIGSLNMYNLNKKSETDKPYEKWSSLSKEEKDNLKQSKKGQSMIWLTIFLPIISCIKYKRWGMLFLCILEWFLIFTSLDISGDLGIGDDPGIITFLGCLAIRIMATNNIIGVNYNAGYFTDKMDKHTRKNDIKTQNKKKSIKKNNVKCLIILICLSITLFASGCNTNGNSNSYNEELLANKIESLTNEYQNKISSVGVWAIETKEFKNVKLLKETISNCEEMQQYINEYINKLDKLFTDYNEISGNTSLITMQNDIKGMYKSRYNVLSIAIERFNFILSIQDSFYINSKGTLKFYDSNLYKYNDLSQKLRDAIIDMQSTYYEYKNYYNI